MEHSHESIKRIVFGVVAVCFLCTGCGIKEYRLAMRTAHERLETSRIVHASRGTIEYAVEGDGVPLLMVHSMGGGFDLGLAYARQFGEGFKVISLSRFGYLRSTMPDSPTVELQADLFAELLDSLKIAQVAVLGASGGGPSALQFAIRHPDRCSHLILVSALTVPFQKPVRVPLLMRMMFKSDYLYWYLTRKSETTLKQFGTKPSVIDALTESDKAWVDSVFSTLHPTSVRYRGFMAEMTLFCAPHPYPSERVRVPVLLVHVKDDPFIDSTHVLHIMKKCPQTRLLEFETGGHFFPNHRAELVSAVRELLLNQPRP